MKRERSPRACQQTRAVTVSGRSRLRTALVVLVRLHAGRSGSVSALALEVVVLVVLVVMSCQGITCPQQICRLQYCRLRILYK